MCVFPSFFEVQTLPLEPRASLAGYTVPDWSSVPDCPYGLEIVKNGVVLGEKDLSQQPFFLIGRVR